MVGRPRDLLAVHADRVEPHLVGGDEQDFAAHASFLEARDEFVQIGPHAFFQRLGRLADIDEARDALARFQTQASPSRADRRRTIR